MSAQMDVLWATANKFFPSWPYLTGQDEVSFWIRLEDAQKTVEVHVPVGTPLDEFEARTWLAFRDVRDRYDLDMATEAASV